MIKTFNLSPQDITLSELEVAARLKTKLGYTDNAVEECKAERVWLRIVRALLRLLSPLM